MQLATVRISDPSTPGGFLTINADDFDAARHVRFDDVLSAPVEPAVNSVEPAATPGADTVDAAAPAVPVEAAVDPKVDAPKRSGKRK